MQIQLARPCHRKPIHLEARGKCVYEFDMFPNFETFDRLMKLLHYSESTYCFWRLRNGYRN